MNKRIPFLAPVLGVVMAGLWCQGESRGQVNERGTPAPFGARISAELQSIQDIYTNYPSVMWCPACVTSSPPCRVACYMVDMTAIARFNFEVANEYPSPRTLHFNDGQRCELELRDQSGTVVAAWSDGKSFTQALNSLTIEPGQRASFVLEIPLKDREGKQLNGSYLVQAYLLTSTPGLQRRSTAVTQISVALAPQAAERSDDESGTEMDSGGPSRAAR